MITDTDKPWFAYHPDYGEFEWFATQQDAVDWLDDWLDGCLEVSGDTWPDDVDQGFVGRATHHTVQCNRVDRPKSQADRDEDGHDWSRVDYICDYKMELIPEGE